MKQFIPISALLLALVPGGCAHETTSANYATIAVDLQHVDKCETDDYTEVFTEPRYTLLRSLDKNDMIGTADKVVVTDDLIYVADFRNNKVVSYSKRGIPQKVLCRIGRGPGEYLLLCDFCVDEDGNLYVNDARLNKVIKYDAGFNFMNDWEIRYDIESFEMLDNNKFLAVLSAWNEGKYENIELALLNGEMEVETPVIMYDEFVDRNVEIAHAVLCKTDRGIFYHRTIDDNVYLLDNDGNITEKYHFSFGEQSVRDKERLNVEKYWDNFKNRTFLCGQIVVFPENVYGTLCDKMENRQFVWTRGSNEIRIENCQDEIPNIGMICGVAGNRLITYIPASDFDATRNFEGFNLTDMDVDDYSLVLCTYEIE
ncbi:6-bladed beta-propeller [uncultured Alistipes sp.]|uniref:6-bladed beta-propeller n=1 Tax=uncultured Alistipes sp. TaxID=538949 RepID=UPI0025F452C3|nr:6-bladed beta-propeller [uncultured Alistipes sp.]